MKKVLGLLALALLVASPALAQVWNEVGDAPELVPGQATVGVGPLTAISGSLTPSNADLFCIRIDNPGAFMATTVGGTSIDTQLFLFDANGLGISHNDDDPTTGVLQSTVTGIFVPSPGLYLLGVSAYNYDPVNASSALIWANTPYNVERAPDGPGAPGPLAAWTGTHSATDVYRVSLTGASFCIPEPGSLALIALAGLALIRRR